MKTTADQLRRAYALARLRGKLRPLGARWAAPAEDPNSLPLNRGIDGAGSQARIQGDAPRISAGIHDEHGPTGTPSSVPALAGRKHQKQNGGPRSAAGRRLDSWLIMRNHKTRKRLARLANRMNGGFGARLIGRKGGLPARIEVGDAVWYHAGCGAFYLEGYERDMTDEEQNAIERSLSDHRREAVIVVGARLGTCWLMYFNR